MGKGYQTRHDFSRGLQTKAVEDGQPLPDFQVFANARVSYGTAAARKGMVRVARPSSGVESMDFVAASSMQLAAPVDTRVWTLGQKWTLEVLVALDDKTLTNTVLYAGHTTPSLVIDTSSSKWRVRHWDEDATLTTLTTSADALESATSLQIVRDGTSLLLRVDNGTETTGSVASGKVSRTPVGDLRMCRGASTDYFDGDYDYIRLFSYARSAHPDSRMRLRDSRAAAVLANYEMLLTDSMYVEDLSRFENTVGAFNSPTSTTALAHQSNGVDGIFQYRDSDNKKQMLLCTGGRYIHSEV